ncbi:MAG: MFS transporter [Chloroflexi bacterium]|nr:MFS transporter [Chloroflexota bacterium]
MITVALGHFASDFSALGPSMLYPILAVRLEMSYGMIGLAALAWALTTSVIQPLFGYIGDRMGRRWLASISPAWIAVWVAVAAFAPSYPLLVVYLVVAAVGVAAFHPQGAAIANEAQGRNTGTNVALFFLGGHAAFAVAPLILGGVLEAGGTDWVPVVLAPVLVVSAFMA